MLMSENEEGRPLEEQPESLEEEELLAERLSEKEEEMTEALLEMSLLRALYEKGPALPVELAVRTYSLPDEISAPLQSLEGHGYIARQRMKKGEMYVLTKEGYHRAQRGLREEAF
jgi:DNA-binding MarR family transcriptional regulator